MLPRVILFIAALFIPALALADGPDPKMKLLFLGTSPEAGAPGPLPADLPAITLDTLPTVEAAQQTVFAARLRSSPVSTFVAQPGPDNAQFEQFFLVADVGLTGDANGHRMTLGRDSFALDDFANRVSAIVSAFNPKHRRIGLIHMSDPDDVFPTAIAEVQSALDTVGFDMMVVMIGDPSGCEPGEALHYSLISGLADRAPFGDGNGVSDSGEVETYLTQALNRQTERAGACGPRYSVLLKSSNDPSEEMIAFKGRAPFTEVETRLYNESFEARFLLASDNRESVQEFLATCHYCPHERELTDRLRDMQEHARSTALEAEIWERIKDDEDPARLAIYLETCTLCTRKADVEDRIAILKAKAEARAAEATTFEDASASRDLVTLRDYVESCVACDHVAAARALVVEIEADEAYRAEIAALDIALEAEDVVLLKAFIDDCEICEGRDRAETTLDRVTRRITLVDPCLAAAGVPQFGGPRQLTEIDQQDAAQLCGAAAAEFPNAGEVEVTLGRIAQAAGDFDRAAKHYVAGVEMDVPAGYGLSAYLHYAPPEGVEINLVEAERLAQIGASKGDWLSREILTVLYSKGLVPGRTPEEAFDIAKGLAAEGNAIAHYFVGTYYLSGTGVEENRGAAQEALQKAVDQGFTLAMSDLAEIYESADIPNVERASALFWTALQAGDEIAIDRLTTQISNRNREVIRTIQSNLNELGKYRGPLDGIPGPGTVRAIRAYADSLVEQG